MQEFENCISDKFQTSFPYIYDSLIHTLQNLEVTLIVLYSNNPSHAGIPLQQLHHVVIWPKSPPVTGIQYVQREFILLLFSSDCYIVPVHVKLKLIYLKLLMIDFNSTH